MCATTSVFDLLSYRFFSLKQSFNKLKAAHPLYPVCQRAGSSNVKIRFRSSFRPRSGCAVDENGLSVPSLLVLLLCVILS